LQLAEPLVTGPEHVALPSLNTTPPVNIPAPGGFTATVAATAIGELTADGFGVCMVSVVVVAACATVRLPFVDPLLLLLAKIAVPV
jgi:hypothetical protein